jgi:hypothetical protein
MGPLDKATQEQNRELIAQRLGWPDGALDATRDLEARFPGYSVWWGSGRVTDPRPGYYAIRAGDYGRGPTLYAVDADAMGFVISAHEATRPRDPWERPFRPLNIPVVNARHSGSRERQQRYGDERSSAGVRKPDTCNPGP